MNAHQLDANGAIINTIVVDSLDVLPSLVDAAIGGGIGDSIINGVLIPRAAPASSIAEAVPMLNLKLILADDGKTAAVEAVFAGMTGTDRDRALAYWTAAQTARRDNYLVNELWPLIGYDAAGFADAWARAAALNP